MGSKIGKFLFWSALSIIMLLGVVISEDYSCSVGVALASALSAILIEQAGKTFVDIMDTTNWKTSQRKLKRGGFIHGDTIIRISFAYLYRIKVGDKYLLVSNSRNTGKYQPVGGVYKYIRDEKLELKNLFHIMDDDKIPIDESSRDDYRLRVKNRYIRKFVRRFNSKKSSRERIDNVGREFREELIEKGILNWKEITYRYCGRYMSDIRFEEHFQVYEMQLFDVVELIPTEVQEQELNALIKQKNKAVRFATSETIECLGANTEAGKLGEWIGDHTKVTTQEYETELEKVSGVGGVYSISLSD